MDDNIDVLNLLNEHAGILRKLCYLYTNSSDEFKDLMQEMNYQLVKSYPSFEGKSKLSTWVYRVSLFTALTWLRRKPREQPVEEFAFEPATDDAKDDPWPMIMHQIKKLRETERTLIFLYLEDKSYREMSEILGLTESNIGVRLNRIKTKLKKYFKDNHGT